jgi:hypothetical protein
MKRHHPPILTLGVLILLAILSIAGGPIVFMVLLMAAPLIMIFVLLVYAFFHADGGTARAEYERSNSQRSGGLKAGRA